MKIIFSLFFVLSSFSVLAEVSPKEVESMINQMIKENVIDAQEGEKAKIKMRQMSADQWKQVNNQAREIASRAPASIETSSNSISEVHKIDLDGEQFKQIQRDMERIVPVSK